MFCLLLAHLTRGLVYGSLSIFLCSTANADLKELDEASLAMISARSGLTIDIKTNYTIGEFEYVDAGSMFWRDISFEGLGNGLRAKIDISDGQETLASGFSDIAMLADAGYLDSNDIDIAWAMTEYDTGSQYGEHYGDGDLLIHVTSVGFGIDFDTPPSPANQQANLDALKNAAGFIYKEGEFGIRSSDKQVETILSSNFSVEAYLGYFDILLTNHGNGFHERSTPGAPKNVTLQDSYIALDLKFRVEDLDIEQTNNVTNLFVPIQTKQPYLTLKDMRIHNERGADTLGSFGFASVETKIAATSGILNQLEHLGSNAHPTWVDGQSIYDINVKWDWDLPHISFGDTGQSIGQVYLTDFHIEDTSLVISAH